MANTKRFARKITVQAPPPNASPMRTRRRGFAIVELMIALVLSGFVMTMVFYSWKYISDHTFRQQRKTLFQTEADRIAQTIISQIRKSPEVLRMTPTSISFLSPGSLDTIAYEFINGSFRRNETEIWSNDRSARIAQFSIEKENPSLVIDTSNSVPILVTMVFQDRFGNTSTIPLKVRAVMFPDRFTAEPGQLKGWNY